MEDQVKKIVEENKASGYSVVLIKIDLCEYIFRSISRGEWRKILSARYARLKGKEKDPLAMLESQEFESEEIAQSCTLYPIVNFDKLPAGVVLKLSDEILRLSSFEEEQLEVKRL